MIPGSAVVSVVTSVVVRSVVVTSVVVMSVVVTSVEVSVVSSMVVGTGVVVVVVRSQLTTDPKTSKKRVRQEQGRTMHAALGYARHSAKTQGDSDQRQTRSGLNGQCISSVRVRNAIKESSKREDDGHSSS